MWSRPVFVCRNGMTNCAYSIHPQLLRTNYEHGRHSASPEGCVRWPAERDVLLLHYKRLGLDYEISRSAELRRGFAHAISKAAGARISLLPPEKIAERSES